MSIGPAPTRLSERLLQQMEETTNQQGDLTKQALESFNSDLQAILNNARTIIDKDTHAWIESSQNRLSAYTKTLRQRLWLIERMAILSPLMLIVTSILIIGAVYYLSSTWAADRTNAVQAQLHMQTLQQQGRTIVAFDREKTETIPCGQRFRCIIVKE